MQEIPCFFIMADRHYQASLELYEKKFFDFAVFHLQQSVETGFKAYLMALEFSNLDEVKQKVGHKSSQILPLLSSKMISDIENKLGPLPEIIKKHIQENEHPITEYASKIDDLVSIPLEIIEELIKRIGDDNTRLLSIGEKFKGKELNFAEFVSLMTQYQYNIEEVLTTFSLIFEKHEQRSRYYDRQTGCPNEFYSESNPLVIKFPELSAIIKYTIKNLGIFIENFNRFNSQFANSSS